MSPVLSVPTFGGGIVLEGSADAQRTDELREADGYDIGPRGALVAASDRSDWYTHLNGGSPLSNIYGFSIVHVPKKSFLVIVGDAPSSTFICTATDLSAAGPTMTNTPIVAPLAGGISVTVAHLPYVATDHRQKRVVLVCLGARPGDPPSAAAGLWVLVLDPASPTGLYTCKPISDYDSLGTGPNGEFPGGLNGQMLKPRGVIIYNSHAFVWGFDSHDNAGGGALGTFDGPNRLMFSNLGNPLKWGNDPEAAAIAGGAAETDRQFVDSDAFTIGGAGESIRAAIVWSGKLWLATDGGLHYVDGFGRESFLTNGALAITNTHNAIGPHAIIEGPDRLLHGVSDEGHWIFDGSSTETPGEKLRDYNGKSLGYWDLIWSAPNAAAGWPGKTNQDCVWMLALPDLHQVWIGIPFCSVANGYGPGTDTVLIKYHCRTGGYTRQQFVGAAITAGDLYRRDQSAVVQTILASTGAVPNMQRYGYKATAAAIPIMPTPKPVTTIGEYAPHGVTGVGIVRKFYLTLSWESAAALPLVFTVTPIVDGKATTPVKVTIAPGAPPGTPPAAPSTGDLWVDTSGTDPNFGNGTGGDFTPASPGDYLLRVWIASWAKWSYKPGMGQQGTRVTIPIAHDINNGSRIQYRVLCITGTGRYQVEGMAFGPPETTRSAA
jgi:hypothetical protein